VCVQWDWYMYIMEMCFSVLKSDEIFYVRCRGYGETGQERLFLKLFVLSMGVVFLVFLFFLFPSNLLAIYFYLCVVPFSGMKSDLNLY